MIDVRCRCGEFAAVTYSGDMYGIRCGSCKCETGPHSSFDKVYRSWYGLVPIRDSAEDVCSSMKRIIMEVSCREGYVPAEELTGISESVDAGRRALHILVDTGLLRARYVSDGEEVTFDEAVVAKRDGKKVSTSFAKAFSRNNS